MKPKYFALIFFALAITAFADAIEVAFGTIIPGAGFIIGIPLAAAINITAGAGLVVALWMNGMFHPNFGPFGVVAGAIPGIDSLPIWLGLVIAGIIYDLSMDKETAAGLIPGIAKAASGVSLKNPSSVLKGAREINRQIADKAPASVNSDVRPRTPLQNVPSAHEPYVQQTV